VPRRAHAQRNDVSAEAGHREAPARARDRAAPRRVAVGEHLDPRAVQRLAVLPENDARDDQARLERDGDRPVPVHAHEPRGTRDEARVVDDDAVEPGQERHGAGRKRRAAGVDARALLGLDGEEVAGPRDEARVEPLAGGRPDAALQLAAA